MKTFLNLVRFLNPRLRISRWVPLLMAGLLGVSVARAADDTHDFKLLWSFGGTNEPPRKPVGLTRASDGFIYGVSRGGGRYNYGTIFKVHRDWTGYAVLHEFGNDESSGRGFWPEVSLMEGRDGRLYGTTGAHFSSTGPSGGILYRINKDGRGFKVLHEFNASQEGYRPDAKLLQASDGLIYGMTEFGGVAGHGVIFRIQPDGRGYRVLRHMGVEPSTGLPAGSGPGLSEGRQPVGGLIEGRNGFLYGITRRGGQTDGGVIFRISATGEAYTPLHEFGSFAGDGRTEEKGVMQPAEGLRLVQVADGTLYGVTMFGGVHGLGTCYRIGPNGSDFRILHHFNAHIPIGSGEPAPYIIAGFPIAFPSSFGWHPTGPMMDGGDGRVYTATLDGGVAEWISAGKRSVGSIFSIMSTGGVQVWSVLGDAMGVGFGGGIVRDADGSVSVGASVGGPAGNGTVVSMKGNAIATAVGDGVAISGQCKLLSEFQSIQDGSGSMASFFLGEDDTIYGTSDNQGSARPKPSEGIFRIAIDGSAHAYLRVFTRADGTYLNGLIEGPDKRLYGTTVWGGTWGRGRLFSLGKDGTGFRAIHDFAGNRCLEESVDGKVYIFPPRETGYKEICLNSVWDAGRPVGRLFTGRDGYLYGVGLDSSDLVFPGWDDPGGLQGFGTVFRTRPDGSGFSVQTQFRQITPGPSLPDHGFGPKAVVEGQDDKLYGITARGGTADKGFLFCLDKQAAGVANPPVQILHSFQNGPPETLFRGSDGAMYGLLEVTQSAGMYRFDAGGFFSTPPRYSVLSRGRDGNLLAVAGNSVVRLDRNGNILSQLYSFDANGPAAFPTRGELFEGKDGSIYGKTAKGGDYGRGVLYRLLPKGTSLNQPPALAVTPPAQQLTVGVPFSIPLGRDWFQDADSDQSVSTTVDTTTLPPGIVFDATKASLSGVPTRPGEYLVRLRATDDGVPKAETTFDWIWSVRAVDVLFGFASDAAPALSVGAATVDGDNPIGAPIENWEGKIYGTTRTGGASNMGTVYEYDPVTDNYRLVHTFVGTEASGGYFPVAGLVEAQNHVLYGTTTRSAPSVEGDGTVFRIIADGGRSDYRELHVFRQSEGQWPMGALVEDRAGWLYGTTQIAGQYNNGTLFRIRADDSGAFEVLHHFQGEDVDGQHPSGGLTPVYVRDALGNVTGLELYGTTEGTIFRFSTNGNQLTTLVRFHWSSADRLRFLGTTLLATQNGTLYGVSSPHEGRSALFRLSDDRSSIVRLATFENQPSGLLGLAGMAPSSLAEATDPVRGFRLFGTSRIGGDQGWGTIWEWNAVRGFTSFPFWQFGQIDPADGRQPSGAIGVTTSGIWGVAESGGTGAAGTLFRFVPTYTGQLVNYNRYRGHLHDFGRHANRQIPPLSVLAGRDNMLYGCTAHDGVGGGGTVFKMTADGTTRVLLHQFGASAGDGLHPAGAPMEGSDGYLYGCTSEGGAQNYGRIYRMNKNGGEYRPLYDFKGQNWPDPPDGTTPIASLVEAPDGRLYGSTRDGGLSGATFGGALFRINKDGTGYELLHSFDEQADFGFNPTAPMIVGLDGALYGALPNTEDPFYGGCLFRLGLDGAFTRYSTHVNSRAPLLLGSDRKYYGTTSSKWGDIFSFQTEPFSQVIPLMKFSQLPGDGTGPLGSLLEGRNGMLCGVTEMGGDHNQGTLFVVNKDGSGYRVIKSFGPDSNSDGAGVYPYSVTQTSDGTIFVSTFGGPNNSEGSLWRYSPANQSPRLVAPLPPISAAQYVAFAVPLPAGFVQDPDGGQTITYAVTGLPAGVGLQTTNGIPVVSATRFPPETGLILTGTPAQSGTFLVRVVAADSGWVSRSVATEFVLTVVPAPPPSPLAKLSFKAGSPAPLPEATSVNLLASSLALGWDGTLFGTSIVGGDAGMGLIFSVNPIDGSQHELFSFQDGVGGHSPAASVIQGNDGYLYGTARAGGVYGQGTIFRVDTNGANFSVLHNFGSVTNDGLASSAALVELGDGLLYGTAELGGAFGQGTVFRLSRSGSDYTNVYHFGSTMGDGRGPVAGLLAGSDGMLYGTTSNPGTVFRVAPDGSGFTNIHHFGMPSDGRDLRAGIIEDTAHRLYGTAATGGDFGLGTVFRVNRDGSDFQVVHHFAGTPNDGANPVAALSIGPDDRLHGMTAAGGLYGYGTVYQLAADGADWLLLRSFSGTAEDGRSPTGSLVEGRFGSRFGVAMAGNSSGLVTFRFGPENQPPVSEVEIGDQIGTVGSAFQLELPATLFTDPDLEQRLTLSVVGLPVGVGFNGASRTIAGSPAQAGEFWISVVATDNGWVPSLGTNRFRLAVVPNSPGNHAPVVYRPVAHQTATNGAIFALTLPPDAIVDPDAGQRLNLWAYGLPPGIQFDATNGTFFGVPSGSGVYSVAISAVDNGSPPLSTSLVFQLEVISLPAGWSHSGAWSAAVLGNSGAPGGLLAGSDGLLYGPMATGGTGQRGSLFKFDPTANSSISLHHFAADGRLGAYPVGGLVETSEGTLFGTTFGGGTNFDGVLFRIDRGGNGFAVVHHFFSPSGDGSRPNAALLDGHDGYLYGTTSSGGQLDGGVLFRMRTDGNGYEVVFRFDGSGGTHPTGRLVVGMDGDLYGITTAGGQENLGTLFRVRRTGSAYQVLRHFSRAVDRGAPTSLIRGIDGVFYGATGSRDPGGESSGAVFRIDWDGTDHGVLHTFSSANGGGWDPVGLMDLENGSLGGVTRQGGAHGGGTFFQVTTSGEGYVTLLHFSPAYEGGFSPSGELCWGADGMLYGVTERGGPGDAGTLFSLRPPNRSPRVRLALTDQFVIAGGFLSYSLPEGLFSDPDPGQTLTYSVSGLPAGFSFDPATRSISGSSPNWGAHTVIIEASDNGEPSLRAQGRFKLTVYPPRYGVTAFGSQVTANLPGWRCEDGGYCWAEVDAGTEVRLWAYPSFGGIVMGWRDGNGGYHRGPGYSFVLERTVVLYTDERRPFGGYARAVPGAIEAEDFDGQLERDRVPGDSGYRVTDVDLAAHAGGGLHVGGTVDGEWLEYTVNVVSNGYYRVDTRLSAPTNLVLRTDGVDDELEVSGISSLGLSFTLEAWIYPSPTDANYHGFLGNQMGNEVATRSPGLWIYEGNRLHGGFGDGTTWKSWISGPVLRSNAWNHVAATYGTGSWRVYVNGDLVFTQPMTGIPYPTPIRWIGRVDSFFPGMIDEVRVWSRARRAEEIQATLYRSLVGNEAGLSGYWNFQQGQPLNLVGPAGVGTQRGGASIASAVRELHFEFADGDITRTVTLPDTAGPDDWQTISSSSVRLKEGPQVIRLSIDHGGMNIDSFQLVPVEEHPPTVAVTVQNAAAASVAGETVILEATATDAEGWVTGVQFLVNGTPTGPVQPGAPASLAWWAAAPGTYTFTAVATDNAGLNTTSAPVSVTLDSIKTIRLGGLKAEYFLGLAGGKLADLTSSDKFINNRPDLVEVAPFFESRRDFTNNYGARLSGWIIPPETGTYVFAMSSDDQGALFLSPDDSPFNKKQIAAEPEWNGYREFLDGWNQPSRMTASGNPTNVSAPQTLVAGKPYYIEALFKEGEGGDHLSVAWRLPSAGVGPLAKGTAPIGGFSLATVAEERVAFQPRTATTLAESSQVCIFFGRVLDQVSATNPANYTIAGATITSIALSPDREGVLLNLSALPMPPFEVAVRSAGGAPIRDIFGHPLPATTTTLPVQILPQSRQDVGAVSAPGVAFARNAADFDVLAGGLDIWGNADGFHFVHEKVTADFDVRVRVESLEPVHRWSKAGLMVREGLTAASRHVTLNVHPIGGTTRDGLDGGYGQNLYELSMRESDSGATVLWAQPGAALSDPGYPNAWLRLRRQGNIFTAFRSADGLDWIQLGQIEQPFADPVRVGLATISHNDSIGLQALARYRDYRNVSGVPSISQQPASIGAELGVQVTFAVTAEGASPLTYQWQKNRQDIPGANAATYTIPSVSEGDLGSYRAVVTDRNGSVVSLPATLTPDAVTRGGLKAEYFLDLPEGTTLDVLTNSAAFRNHQPDIVEMTPHFESRTNWADNYGVRLSGWIVPPITGNYQFYLASDDQGVLFLSSDASPANMRVIASEPSWNGIREFTAGMNQASRGNPATNISGVIALQTGRPYYVEALMKEGLVGDHLAVAWVTPGGPAVVNGSAPIAGSALLHEVPYVGAFQPLSAASLTNSGQIGIRFGRQMDVATATATANYHVAGATVSTAVLAPDREGVLLNVTGLTGSTFSVEVRAVKDLFGNRTPASTVLSGQVLPQGRRDVGTAGDPAVAGATFSSREGEFDIVAGGSDIWGNADGFHFVHQQIAGDFDLKVRVESLAPVNRWTKAGLMVRESLDAGSRHLSAVVTPLGPTLDGQAGGQGNNDYELILRPAAGQPTITWSTNSNVTSVPYPDAWIRVKRSGNNFSAFRSNDGISWTKLGETNQVYLSTVFVGLATTAHNNSPDYTMLAQYRNYTLSTGADQPPISSGFGVTTPQDQALTITFAGLLAPVRDPEGGLVHIVSVSATSTNGAPVVANATGVTYTPKAGFVGADRIDYVVSDSLGATSTFAAQLAVLASGTVVNTAQAIAVTAESVSFGFTGLPARSYHVERADSPGGPWETVGTLTIQGDGSGNYVDPDPPAGSGFYRLRLLP